MNTRLLCAFALFVCAWSARRMLNAGVYRHVGGAVIRRSSDPIQFWGVIFVHAIVALMAAAYLFVSLS
jgi:hypothetical protein